MNGFTDKKITVKSIKKGGNFKIAPFFLNRMKPIKKMQSIKF